MSVRSKTGLVGIAALSVVVGLGMANGNWNFGTNNRTDSNTVRITIKGIVVNHQLGKASYRPIMYWQVGRATGNHIMIEPTYSKNFTGVKKGAEVTVWIAPHPGNLENSFQGVSILRDGVQICGPVTDEKGQPKLGTAFTKAGLAPVCETLA